MAKVAKLVCMSFMTRIIVEDTFTEEQELEMIADIVRQRVVDQVMNDGIGDHLESIEIDEECPYQEGE